MNCSLNPLLRPSDKRYGLHLQDGNSIPKKLSAASHDRPKTKQPAGDGFDEPNQVSEDEIIVRIMIGVRGDRVTGVNNPLVDDETNDYQHPQIAGADLSCAQGFLGVW